MKPINQATQAIKPAFYEANDNHFYLNAGEHWYEFTDRASAVEWIELTFQSDDVLDLFIPLAGELYYREDIFEMLCDEIGPDEDILDVDYTEMPLDDQKKGDLKEALSLEFNIK